MARVIKKMHDGDIKFDSKKNEYFFNDIDGDSKPFGSLDVAIEEYYIKQATDHLGSEIRDNSRMDKIAFGRGIDNGTFDELF